MLQAAVLVGGLTTHYLAPNFNFCGKIAGLGTIANPYTALQLGNDRFKAGILYGKDSSCGEIFGTINSLTIGNYVDFVIGGYNYNQRTFHRRGMEAPNMAGITPIFGADLKLPLYKTDVYEIQLHNLVSFGITTHALGLTFNID